MTNELKGNEKVWMSTVDDVDIYHMLCPLDCGCIAVCMMSWAPGVPYEAQCAQCGDVTEIAWSEGGEE
jgi:hypothetical protein